MASRASQQSDPVRDAIVELSQFIMKHLPADSRPEAQRLVLCLLDADIANTERGTAVLEHKNEQILEYQTLCGFTHTSQN